MDLVVTGEQGFADFFEGGGDKKGKFQKSRFQEISVDKMESLYGQKEEKSIYKLVLKNLWKHEGEIDFEKRGVKGALSLVKATGGGKEKGGDVKEVEVNKDTKVGLIMAQGEETIYLMPVIRISNKCVSEEGSGGKDRERELKKIVEKKGITDIKSGTSDFDMKRDGEKSQDERLTRLMKGGFSITRKAGKTEFVEGDIRYEWSRLATKEELEEINKEEKKAVGNLYKNAGILGFRENAREGNRNCENGEVYFPLDLVVLGNVVVYGNAVGKEKVTVGDDISRVIGVRLEQIVITKDSQKTN